MIYCWPVINQPKQSLMGLILQLIILLFLMHYYANKVLINYNEQVALSKWDSGQYQSLKTSAIIFLCYHGIFHVY